jgi:type IV pilus assembly protein PilW
MKKIANNRHYRQTGFTLVEIMVAITIGLVMIAGILQVSLANKESNRLQRNMGYVQENMRTAMELLGRDLRMAGHYIDDNPAARILTPPAPFKAPSLITTTAVNAPITADGGGANSDQVTLVYEVPTIASTDCLGQPPVNIGGNFFVENHYFIANQRLMCGGSDAAPQPLVDNVENLQILYGENTDGNPLTVNRYVGPQVADMNNVVSVRIGMRFTSREQVRPTADTNAYALLDAAAFTPSAVAPDRRLRREITSTIFLRNE